MPVYSILRLKPLLRGNGDPSGSVTQRHRVALVRRGHAPFAHVVLGLKQKRKRRAEAVQALKFHGMSWLMLEIGQP